MDSKSETTIASKLITFLLVVVAIVATVRIYIANPPTQIAISKTGPLIFIVIVLASIFPISASAYVKYRKPVHQTRIQEDLEVILLADVLDLESLENIDEFREETRKKSEEEVSKLYPKVYSGWHYFLYSTTIFLICIIGLALVFVPTTQILSALSITNEEGQTIIQAMGFGFLGAYIYALQLIYRRYTTLDLQPSVYLLGALNMVAGLTFNFIAFIAISNIGQQSGAEGLFAIIAFSLGYFPTLAIRWFNNLTFNALGMHQREANRLPLRLIDGISQWHETRLNDNGIDNVQNLAAANIQDLLLNTTFSAEEVIDWVDQAILYLYLDEDAIQSFRRAGVRTLSDFQTQWEDYYNNPNRKEDEIEKRALLFQSTPIKLDMLYRGIEAGPNVHNIAKYWTNKRFITEVTREQKIDKFFRRINIKGKLVNLLEKTTPKIFKEVAEKRIKNINENEEDIRRDVVSMSKYHEAFRDIDELVINSQRDSLNFANYHYLKMNYTVAKRLYEDEIKKDDELAEAHNGLALIFLSTEDPPYSKAQEHSEKAVEISKKGMRYSQSDIFRFLDTLISIYIKLGEVENAEKKLADAEEIFGRIKDGEDKSLAEVYRKLRTKEIEVLRNNKKELDRTETKNKQ